MRASRLPASWRSPAHCGSTRASTRVKRCRVQLFSLGHGLLGFCPGFALLPGVAREFGRRFPAEALLIGAVSLSVLAVYSKWWAYWGMSWGPRFLVPTLPLLGLVLLPLTERGRWTRLSLV